MSDDGGEVQVIAQESGLVNPESLASATSRNLRPLPFDAGAPVTAVPGYYDIPVIVDQVLTQAHELALATTEPGGYVKACGQDLTSGRFEAHVVEFTDPVGTEDPRRSATTRPPLWRPRTLNDSG